jgi:hypothetical protein
MRVEASGWCRVDLSRNVGSMAATDANFPPSATYYGTSARSLVRRRRQCAPTAAQSSQGLRQGMDTYNMTSASNGAIRKARDMGAEWCFLVVKLDFGRKQKQNRSLLHWASWTLPHWMEGLGFFGVRRLGQLSGFEAAFSPRVRLSLSLFGYSSCPLMTSTTRGMCRLLGMAEGKA